MEAYACSNGGWLASVQDEHPEEDHPLPASWKAEGCLLTGAPSVLSLFLRVTSGKEIAPWAVGCAASAIAKESKQVGSGQLHQCGRHCSLSEGQRRDVGSKGKCNRSIRRKTTWATPLEPLGLCTVSHRSLCPAASISHNDFFFHSPTVVWKDCDSDTNWKKKKTLGVQT